MDREEEVKWLPTSGLPAFKSHQSTSPSPLPFVCSLFNPFLSPLSFSRTFEDKEAVGSDYLDFFSFSFGVFFCLDRFNPSALVLRFSSLSFNVCFCDYELALKTADLSSEENGSLRILFYSY